MGYGIELGAWDRVFAVPAAVVDRHLKLAGSAQLKVLLFLLRRAGEVCDPEEIGAAVGLSRADVCDAMQYWVEAGLIRERDGALTPAAAQEPASVQEPAAASPAPAEVPAPPPAPPARTPARPRTLDPREVAARINGDEQLRCMLDAVQSILARPLSTPDMGTLIGLHDWDGLPPDVIVMLVQYAAGAGRGSMGYISKMGAGWAADGIDTHEKAEEKIRALDERSRAWSRVSRLFGIDRRTPSTAEGDAAARWVNEWRLPDELIREAYDRCVDSTGKVRFSYINKILERWRAQGVLTLEQARDEQRKKPAAAPSGDKASAAAYDIGEFEKLALSGELISK